VTNSIEQRAAEIRDSAEDGAVEVSPTPTYGFGKDGFGKDGKQVVSKEPVAAPVVQKRWDVWAVGTGLFGHYDDFHDLHYGAAQLTLGLDYRVLPHWLVGIVTDYTYTSGRWEWRTLQREHFQGRTLHLFLEGRLVWNVGRSGRHDDLRRRRHNERIRRYRLYRDRIRVAVWFV